MLTKLQQSFLTTFCLITVLALVIGVYIGGIPRQQMDHGKWVIHTYEVLDRLDELSERLVESQSVTGEAAQQRAGMRVAQTLAELANLVEDNPSQSARIPLLHRAIAAQDINGATHQITNMRNEEQRLLEERMTVWQDAMGRTRIIFLACTAMLYLFVLFAFVVTRREAAGRDKLLALERETAALHGMLAARMAQMVEVQQEIAGQRLNLQNALQTITARTQSITHADGAVIELIDGEEMIYRAASGSMEPFVGLRLKAQGSLSGLAVQERNSQRCDDTETDGRVDLNTCRKVGLRSMIVVPLIHAGMVVGVLKVTSSRVRSFTSEDVATLELMAGLISVTLRDAAASEAMQGLHDLLISQNAQLIIRADADGMTGLKNHRFFQEFLLQEFQRARRYGNALSLILVDVDHFKQFNDRFGHPAGDDVLKKVAAILQGCARPSDCVARYGGEEFAVVLTQTPAENAMVFAERIRQALAAVTWELRSITVSIGVSGMDEKTQDTAALIKQADEALYRSKSNGRDRATLFSA